MQACSVALVADQGEVARLTQAADVPVMVLELNRRNNRV
jgi:hypothetical protein